MEKANHSLVRNEKEDITEAKHVGCVSNDEHQVIKLNFSKYHLQAIPQAAFSLNTLEILALEDHYIENISSGFMELVNLIELYYRQYQIIQLKPK